MAREKLCVGIDIGASSVKICQLKKTSRGLTLEAFGIEPLPADTVVDGALMNSAHVVDALQTLKARCRIKNKQVALAISGHAVIIKKITLPQMTRQALDTSINWEAEQFIPFDINDVYTDVQILGPNRSQSTHMDVLLVAAKKEFVDEYTGVIAEAGFEPAICDIDAFALQTLFEANYAPTPDSSVALVHVGAAKTSVNVVHGHTSAFTRHLASGGNAFTEELQRVLSLSHDEAEKRKLDPATLTPAANTALAQVAEALGADIARSIDFYTSTAGDSAPKQFLLSGGSAALPVLMPALQRHAGVPVAMFNVAQKLELSTHASESMRLAGAASAVVLGLGMRFVGDQSHA